MTDRAPTLDLAACVRLLNRVTEMIMHVGFNSELAATLFGMSPEETRTLEDDLEQQLGAFATALPGLVARATEGGKDAALHDAVAAIYFDDSSDYSCALWNVVRHLAPDVAELLERDPTAAYDESRRRAARSSASAEHGAATLESEHG